MTARVPSCPPPVERDFFADPRRRRWAAAWETAVGRKTRYVEDALGQPAARTQEEWMGAQSGARSIGEKFSDILTVAAQHRPLAEAHAPLFILLEEQGYAMPARLGTP